MKIPKIEVPKIEMPEIPAPQVNVDIPDAVALKGIDKKKPLPVIMMDGAGKPASFGSSNSHRLIKITGDNGKVATVDKEGHLLIADAHSGIAIAEGDVAGHTYVHKFGDAPDFDTGDGAVTVWDGANDGLLGGGAMQYTYSSSADIGLLSSSSGADTVEIEIQGLDENLEPLTQTFTLQGQTDVDLSATGSDFKRVFRMKNVGKTDLVGQVYLRTNGSAQASGVPSTANTVRAIINDGNNQTLMAIYTVPKGKTAYMRSFFASLAGAIRTSNYIMRLRARPEGEVFQLKHKTALADGGTTHFQHEYIEPERFTEGTDIEMTVETTATSITGSDVSAGFDIVLVDI